MLLYLFRSRKKVWLLKSVKTGYSLLEVLVVISLFIILSSIGVVNYGKYQKRTTLKMMRDVSETFPHVVKTCITASGWKIIRPNGTTVYPCNDLDEIGYSCPESSTCNFWPNSSPPPTTDYVCLDVRRVIKGKKYQVHVIANKKDSSDYEVRCGKEIATYTNLRSTTACQTNAITTDDCDW